MWININDKLPKCNEDVIAGGFEDGEWIQEIGFVSEVDTEEDLKNGNWIDFWFKVSHWMELPMPPKQINCVKNDTVTKFVS